jgi:hypothetical protein
MARNGLIYSIIGSDRAKVSYKKNDVKKALRGGVNELTLAALG